MGSFREAFMDSSVADESRLVTEELARLEQELRQAKKSRTNRTAELESRLLVLEARLTASLDEASRRAAQPVQRGGYS